MKPCLIPALLLVAAGSALAQAPAIPDSAYRKDQAEVLAAPPSASGQPTYDRAGFTAAYAKAKRPTVAVLWNRSFSDMLEQETASQIRIDQSQAGVATREVGAVPGYAAGIATGAAVANTTITARDTKTQQATRKGPVERVDLQMRSSFLQTMASAGVRTVDRNLVMRTMAAGRKEGNHDKQEVETAALLKHASLLMEVLNTRDNASPTGWATYVSVKRLSDGVVLTEGYFDGKPEDGAPRQTPKFEANPRGGFREMAPKIGEVGRLIAEQTLARLGEALAH